jgi:hypothetical protein
MAEVTSSIINGHFSVSSVRLYRFLVSSCPQTTLTSSGFKVRPFIPAPFKLERPIVLGWYLSPLVEQGKIQKHPGDAYSRERLDIYTAYICDIVFDLKLVQARQRAYGEACKTTEFNQQQTQRQANRWILAIHHLLTIQ